MSLLIFSRPHFGPWPPEAHTNHGESECAGEKKISQEHLSLYNLS